MSISHHSKDAFRQAADYLRTESSNVRAEWSKLTDEPYPETVDDWMELAARAGLSPDRVLDGTYTAADVYRLAMGKVKPLLPKAAPPPAAPAENPAVRPEYLSLTEVWHRYQIGTGSARERVSKNIRNAADRKGAVMRLREPNGKTVLTYPADLIGKVIEEERQRHGK